MNHLYILETRKMNKQLYLTNLKGKGRGVFCQHSISPDEIIEIAPLLIIPPYQREWLFESKLVDYIFKHAVEEGAMVLALGFGSLYNHAEVCNAGYEIDYETNQITFFALEFIPAHKEICINYSGEYGKRFDEWFESRGISYKL